jgi:phosphoserine aminotransferase
MTAHRIHNFNAGPSALPLPVLEKIQASFLNFNDSGMSITEISHRSAKFDAVLNGAIDRVRQLLSLDPGDHVLFIQGGASLQFAMVPMNFLGPNDTADYINTGTWSAKAIKEARIQGKTIQVSASSEDQNFSYVPKTISCTPGARYVHVTSNNTIKGTQFHQFPETGEIPLVADMSSDIFSRPLPMEKFGLIYAGAQKNLGPSGVCMVIVKEAFLETARRHLPTMLAYKTFAAHNSMYNTPPCFGIYTIDLVLEWIQETFGTLERMAEHNQRKARMLYDVIDGSGFYQATAQKGSRSLMNVTFRLPTAELEDRFVAEALENGLGGLKGHRSVGGCRASIYNAVPIESVAALAAFMERFEQEKG